LPAILLLIFSLLISACGTAVKVHQSGTVALDHGDEAAVLLVYKSNFSNHEHEIFFWNENKSRYNVKVPAGTDTTKGVLIYLPANRSYALSGLLIVNVNMSWEYPFGEELPLFKIKRSQVNQVPYFEIERDLKTATFKLVKSPIDVQEKYLADVRKNFSWTGPINTVRTF
jgi:hypothetical protein